jgi:hypothetical protein
MLLFGTRRNTFTIAGLGVAQTRTADACAFGGGLNNRNTLKVLENTHLNKTQAGLKVMAFLDGRVYGTEMLECRFGARLHWSSFSHRCYGVCFTWFYQLLLEPHEADTDACGTCKQTHSSPCGWASYVTLDDTL